MPSLRHAFAFIHIILSFHSTQPQNSVRSHLAMLNLSQLALALAQEHQAWTVVCIKVFQHHSLNLLLQKQKNPHALITPFLPLPRLAAPCADKQSSLHIKACINLSRKDAVSHCSPPKKCFVLSTQLLNLSHHSEPSKIFPPVSGPSRETTAQVRGRGTVDRRPPDPTGAAGRLVPSSSADRTAARMGSESTLMSDLLTFAGHS